MASTAVPVPTVDPGSIRTRKTSFSSFPDSKSPPTAQYVNGAVQSPPKARKHRFGSEGSSQSNFSHQSRTNGIHEKPTRRLRSQYPQDSEERHVEYILVASFDIDKGSVMSHQYPGAISGDENMLAELMLPDQTHNRSQDWTIFFLHKDSAEEEEMAEKAREARRARRAERAARRQDQEADSQAVLIGEEEVEEDLSSEEDDEISGEGAPLIYVLNLVNTKQDPTAPRGAVVKAMAICTRHPFLHIYRPLLLLALEEYFKAPVQATLEVLYDAVNAMDLSLMPKLSLLERQILQSSDTKDLFVEKFQQMITQRMDEENLTGENSASPTRSSNLALPRDTHEYESRVLYNGIPVPIKVPTAISPETVGDFSLIKLITTFSVPHTQSPQPFALHPHLTTSGAFTHPMIVLVNAILTQKRVIFLGYNRPSGDVAEAVLAACALVSGSILRGFTRHAFPYTDLSKIDALLLVPGFIAGVTNPTFANHPEWWDLMCDISTGRIKISSRVEAAPLTEGLASFQQQHPGFAPSNTGSMPMGSGDSRSADPSGDAAFMEDNLRAISARHGEPAVRAKWHDYIARFTRIAAEFEESVYGASALYIGAAEADAGAFGVSGHGYVWSDESSRTRELGANVWRIEGWRNTRSYYALIQDIAALWSKKPIRNLDVAHHIDRLRSLRLSREDAGAIYLALEAAVHSYDEICQLLTALPEQHSGLFFLGLGLFHEDEGVREAVVRLLDRIRECVAARHLWSGLGRAFKTQFWRLRAAMTGDGEDGQLDGYGYDGGDMEDEEVEVTGGRPRTASGRS